VRFFCSTTQGGNRHGYISAIMPTNCHGACSGWVDCRRFRGRVLHSACNHDIKSEPKPFCEAPHVEYGREPLFRCVRAWHRAREAVAALKKHAYKIRDIRSKSSYLTAYLASCGCADTTIHFRGCMPASCTCQLLPMHPARRLVTGFCSPVLTKMAVQAWHVCGMLGLAGEAFPKKTRRIRNLVGIYAFKNSSR
jgi:hypothetical protein